MLIPDPETKRKAKKYPYKGERTQPSAEDQPPPTMTVQDVRNLRQALMNNENEFYIVATPTLRDALTKGEPPVLLKMDQWKRNALIEGKGIRISAQMLTDWLDGKLHPANSMVLDYSDIGIERQDFKVKGNDKA